MSSISAVVGSYNRLEFLKLAIVSIREQKNCFFNEIIVIDGGSSDGSLEWLLTQKDIIAIVQHNRGKWLGRTIERRPWGYFMNLAFKCVSSKYVCMISDDTILHKDAIHNAVKRFEELLLQGRKIGAMAFYWRETFQDALYHVGVPAGNLMYVNHGIFLSDALQRVDYIDENNFKFYCADIDLGFKLWAAGYEIVAAQDSYVEHYPYAALDVRKGNEQIARGDFDKIIHKWQSLYPKLNNRNLGDMHKKAYADPYQATQEYTLIHRKLVRDNRMYFLKKFLCKYWQAVYGFVRFRYRKLRGITSLR